MLELLFMFGVLAVGVFVLVGILKLLVVLLLLPLKLAWWTAKGLAGLLLAIPLLVLFFFVATGAFPVVVMMLVLPVILVVVGVGFLMRLVLC
jgi:hypothetical protein